MATLRKDGRWMARRRMPDGTRPLAYGATAQEAEENLNQLVHEMHTLSNAILTTFHDVAVTVWYPRIEHLKPLSRKKYEGIYVNWVRPALGTIPPEKITATTVQSLINRVASKRSPKTTKYVRDITGQILKCAEERGIVARNVCQFVKTPKPNPKRNRVLEVEEAQALLDAVLGTDMSAPVFLATVLGMRRGEIAGLKWNDLNRQRGELKLSRQRQALSKQGVVESPLKSDSERTLTLTPTLIEQLDLRGDLDSEYVCTYRMEPWVPDTITEKWIEVRPESLSHWTFHDLRHGASGLLYAMGHGLLEIAAVLGHKRIDTTLLYTEQTKDAQARAVASMDALFP